MKHSQYSAGLQQSLDKTAAYLAQHRTATGVVMSMMAAVVLTLDFTTSPYIEYSIVYAILIACATQFAAWQLGLALAVLVPLGHLTAYFVTGQQPYPLSAELINIALLFFVGIATVYLLRTLKHMEELRRENVKLETLKQTMITVNDIVLNRLQVMQFMMHLAEQGKPLSPEQTQLGKVALEDMAARLQELSHLQEYETTEVTAGVHAVRVPKQNETRSSNLPAPAVTRTDLVDPI
jgi:hypothetical protein